MPQKPLPPAGPFPTRSALSPEVRGARVRWVLKQYDWSARELADQIQAKESRMSKMLNGSRSIEADDAVRISYVLGIPPDWILWGDRRRLDRKLRKKLPPDL
jgi:transcriptional regulator with XRE-family HTH domain